MSASRIVISYSHQGKGQEWKAKLLQALHVFEQQHLLDVWQDGKIRVSAFWDDDIRQAMSNAQVAVVLLEALESEYILKTEFPFLREQQQQGKLTVFPVVCEDCDWRTRLVACNTSAERIESALATLRGSARQHIPPTRHQHRNGNQPRRPR